ncbi:hypothetical protein A6E12_11710 [Aliivibrio fischeri]|uniref:hypothetical protein n=1 Tax=Aliivibrio fischeri TaxID=668 RepID=UPI00080DFAB2|nr:hypothetical protein [Aliivibrio fischeri]OCH27152.1 hypothetical protein A6E12_11710 [Aliivibrio fischeri]
MLPVTNQTFWDSVWASLLASCLMTFVITALVLWCISIYRKPKLEVFLDIGHRIDSDKVLHLSFVNHGRGEIKSNELRWFLYMDFNLQPKNMPKTGLLLDNEFVYEVIGTNEDAIHPDSVVNIANVVVKSNFETEPDNVDFFIAISTSQGQWKPRKKLKVIKLKTLSINRNVYKIENVTS